MNRRSFWKRSLFPAVVITGVLLASTLLLPVGVAYWTETLWGTGTIKPLDWYTLTPAAGNYEAPAEEISTPDLPPTEIPSEVPTETKDPGDSDEGGEVVDPFLPVGTLNPGEAGEDDEGVESPVPVETEEPGDSGEGEEEVETPGSSELEPIESLEPGETGPGEGEEETPGPSGPAPTGTAYPENPGQGEEGYHNHPETFSKEGAE